MKNGWKSNTSLLELSLILVSPNLERILSIKKFIERLLFDIVGVADVWPTICSLLSCIDEFGFFRQFCWPKKNFSVDAKFFTKNLCQGSLTG